MLGPHSRRHSVQVVKLLHESPASTGGRSSDMVVEPGSNRVSFSASSVMNGDLASTTGRLRRRSSAPVIFHIEEDLSGQTESISSLADSLPPTSSTDHLGDHDGIDFSSTPTNTRTVPRMPSRARVSDEWSSASAGANTIRGAPTRAGLQRVNTQLSDWVDSLEPSSPETPSTPASDFGQSKSNISTVDSHSHNSINSPSKNDDATVDEEFDIGAFPHPERRITISEAHHTNIRESFERRTVSWSGLVEDLLDKSDEVNDNDEPVDQESSDLTDSPPEMVHYGSNPLRSRQFSNVSKGPVYFRDHRDSVELYVERARQIKKGSSSFPIRRRTTLSAAKPELKVGTKETMDDPSGEALAGQD